MSSINPNNIDGSYPIAGQDNDSQGFRDNFTNIKNNFTFAAAELKDLQDNAILKTALAGTTLDNNLNYAILKGAQLIKTVETKNDLGSSLSGTVPVDWSLGHFQTITSTGGSITLTFSNWPTSGFFARFELDIIVTSTAHTLTLPSAVSVNLADVAGASGQTITFPVAGRYRYEFSTYDGGTTILIRDLINNYQTSLGAQIETGYQQLKPTANIAVTGNVNVNRILLHPTGTIISFGANVTLPNTQADGTIVSISSNVTIASLDVRPAWNGVVAVSPSGNTTSVIAGTVSRYMYINADKIWYKIA